MTVQGNFTTGFYKRTPSSLGSLVDTSEESKIFLRHNWKNNAYRLFRQQNLLPVKYELGLILTH